MMLGSATRFDIMKYPIASHRFQGYVETMKAIRKANRFSLNRGIPMPLWMKARAHATDFRHEDLERTHWKKVMRSMFGGQSAS